MRRWLGWIGTLAFAFQLGCGQRDDQSALPQGVIPVKGSAQFGSQCPYGSFVAPRAAPLELWSCPIGDEVELTEPLQPMILQADCKKKTLDIRSGTNANSVPTTWEIMPDGTFALSIDAGVARLRNDGAGHSNCSIRLAADLWGKLDCKDRDKVDIYVETVWWLGKTLSPGATPPARPPTTGPGAPFPNPSPLPSALPSALPSGLPSGVPSPWPSVQPTPSPSPLPLPSGSPRPNPFPSWPSVFPSPRPLRSEIRSENPPEWPTLPAAAVSPQPTPAPLLNPCRVPPGCYFHTIVRIDQCS